MLYAVEIACLVLVEAEDTSEAEHLALHRTDRQSWLDPVATVEQVEEIADIPEHHREHPAVLSVLGWQMERE